MCVDLILIGGRIWTENPQQPEAEALAISGKRVTHIGRSSELLKLRGPRTRVVELNNRLAVPGFNDAHVHFYIGGASLRGVQLRTANTPAEFRRRIADFVRAKPANEWILFGQWDPEDWSPAQLPSHSLIDDVSRDNPVFVIRVDGHTSLANAVAMKLAGVNKDTPDVPGGEIQRDAAGNPTGIFKDSARNLIARVIPPPSIEQMVHGLSAAQDHAIQHGVTSVQDMGLLGVEAMSSSPDLLRAYQRLLHRRELKVRVSLHVPLPAWRRLADLGITAGFGNHRFHIGAVKGFADGSLGSTTAWFFDPYNDAPQTHGLSSDELCDEAAMYSNMVESDRAGLQLAIHAIGDRANNTVLNLFERLERECGARGRRLRIEHAQHLTPADIPRFARQRVIASVQPYHLLEDGCWANRRIGMERARHSWALRSLLDSGAMLAFGSDWWVAPINPLLTIYAAVTRCTRDGKHPDGWIPEEKISVLEAVHAYTAGSAYASGEDQVKGSLEPGKLADIAVLSEDIFRINPNDIQHVKVDVTILDGEVVYERR